jgi:lipoprotein-releasing system ATP-binding protein
MTPLVRATGVSKVYDTGSRQLQVLRELDMEVARGEMVAVMGASGVGKSTLLHLLGGLDRAGTGAIQVADVELSSLSDEQLVDFRNKNVGFVFQFHHLLPEFSAAENVEMPMRIARRPAAEARRHAEALLDKVGLSERRTHKPGMLSGGEQQRVAVARALVMGPALLLADEPTGSLDENTAAEVQRLLRAMHVDGGLTSIVATHNERFASACDRVLRLEHGQLRQM